MHYVYWIITFLFLVVFVTFTVANRHIVAIDFWPFEYQLGLPVALVLLGCLLAGFLVGAFLMWLRFGAARARARRAEQRATILERELVEAKRNAAVTRPAAPGDPHQITHSGGGLKTASGSN